jgi:phytoene dehydrogenase-like protein
MPQLPTVAIIGAGSSGITAAKARHERGLQVDCFEASDRIGGNHPSLAFVGLLQPVGAIVPLAEAQARVLADYVLAAYRLPSRAADGAGAERTAA